MSGGSAPGAAVLLTGEDEVVRREAVRRVVSELVGDADASVVVDEVVAGAPIEAGADPLVAVVQAAETPPLLGPTRVVVARVGDRRTTAASVAPLVEYLGNPLESTTVVLDWAAGKPPKSLVDSVVAAGGRLIDTNPPARRAGEWVAAKPLPATYGSMRPPGCCSKGGWATTPVGSLGSPICSRLPTGQVRAWGKPI